MKFITALKHLEKLGEANFSEFAESTNIPPNSASVSLSRLFKMGFANRRIDARYKSRKYRRKPYLYKVSKKGKRYLHYIRGVKKTTFYKKMDRSYRDEMGTVELLRLRKERQQLERELEQPNRTQESQDKVTIIIDGQSVKVTPKEKLDWMRFEVEREERRRERIQQRDEHWEEKSKQDQEQKSEDEEDLVEWVIGEGNTAKMIKVRPETLPFLIQAQQKKDDKSPEVKEKVHEYLKEQQNQANQFQTQTNALQNEIDELKKQVAVDPIDRMVEQKDKMVRLGLIQPSEEKQTHHDNDNRLKGSKLFDREHRKGLVRDTLLPRDTGLRPMDIINTTFTYEQAIKEDEPLRSEPSHVGALFPRPLRRIWGRLF